VKVQQRTIRGTPDIIMCVNGIFIALELKKSDKEKPDLLQDHELRSINLAGGIGVKVTPENWKNVYVALQTLSKGFYYDRDQIRAA
jgi:hypothetical protein